MKEMCNCGMYVLYDPGYLTFETPDGVMHSKDKCQDKLAFRVTDLEAEVEKLKQLIMKDNNECM